jgi:hypothetical protein
MRNSCDRVSGWIEIAVGKPIRKLVKIGKSGQQKTIKSKRAVILSAVESDIFAGRAREIALDGDLSSYSSVPVERRSTLLGGDYRSEFGDCRMR